PSIPSSFKNISAMVFPYLIVRNRPEVAPGSWLRLICRPLVAARARRVQLFRNWQSRHQAKTDIHALQLEVGPKPERRRIVSRVFFILDDADRGPRQWPAALGGFC